jgi:transposase InsO family protein
MGNNITQRLKYKESVVKYSYKYGVTKAAIVYCECRRTIYRWRKRYDGSLNSLKDRSRRPHYHPNQHTEEELKLIRNYKANNKETGLVVLWVKLRRAGYKRTIQGLYYAMRRLGIYKKPPSKKKDKQPSEWISGTYPGDKVQIDVKYVPQECMTEELKDKKEKYYQYTAIDEFTRIRYTWFTNEHSTYMSSEFVKRVIKYFPFKIETIQTDNGFEFTNKLSWNTSVRNRKTLFESTLEDLGIKHKLIKPYTPKENGRVERSHRKDQERFYYKNVFYNLEDLRNKGKEWRKEYNNFPMKPLGWLSPNEFLKRYKSQEESVMAI